MRFAPSTSAYSLKYRLLWLLFAAIGVTAIIQTAIAYKTSLDEANEIFDYHMEQVARSLRGGLPASSIAEKFVRGGEEENFDLVIQVWSLDGAPVFISAARAALPQRAVLGFSNADANGKSYRVYSMQTPNRVIQIAQEMSVRHELAQSLAMRTVLPILLLAPILLGLVWWLVTRAVNPILEAQRQVASREADDLSPLAYKGLPDEVKPLVVELNLLFERLRQAFATQKAFIADAAHELRSPLAALRLQAQSILRSDNDETRDTGARRLIGGVDRATKLVEQLLSLAQHESGQNATSRLDRVRLIDIVQLAMSDVIALAQQKQMDLGLAPGDAGLMRANGESLRILVRNLLENAIKYTPVGGVIDIAIEQTDSSVRLFVEDSGPGIAPEYRERAFDRFFRAGGSEETGSGLGLAIVKAIAGQHGATVALKSSDRLGGLKVWVDFQTGDDGAKSQSSELHEMNSQ